MFKARAMVQQPEKVALEITMSATVEEWKAVAASMGSTWPDWQFASVIGQAIRGTVEHVETAREVES